MTKAFCAYNDGPKDVPASLSSIGYLSLPPGKFAIFAKLYLAQGSGDPTKVTPNQVTARLEAGGDFDVSVTTVGIADNNPFRSGCSAVSLSVIHDFPTGGVANVKLDKKPDGTPYLTWCFLKITAIQVDSLDYQANPFPWGG